MTTTAPSPTARPGPTDPPRWGWRAPAGLIALGLVPVVAGALRLTQLAGGAEFLPADEGLASLRVPLVAHIVTVTVYALLGAFQFAPGLRARRRRWHRVAGRLLVLCGLVGAASGLWLTLADDAGPLTAFRLVFGTAWAVFLVLGFAAIRSRDAVRHRHWMIRAHAVAMGAGTQVFTVLPWVLLVGEPGELAEALLMLAGWVLNLAVAEWLVRRPARIREAS